MWVAQRLCSTGIMRLAGRAQAKPGAHNPGHVRVFEVRRGRPDCARNTTPPCVRVQFEGFYPALQPGVGSGRWSLGRPGASESMMAGNVEATPVRTLR